MQATFSVLVVGDDQLLGDTLHQASITDFPEATFIQVYNALEAVTYINGLEGYGPRLVLLDINLANGDDGFDLLVYLRVHQAGRFIPVVVLSTSQSPAIVKASYTRGAASFTGKPLSLPEWKQYLSNLRLYWAQTVTLPRIQFRPLEYS